MKAIKTICFVTPTLDKGGMERVLSELSNYGVENDFNIYIICLIPGGEIAYQLDKRVQVIEPDFRYERNVLFKIRSFIFLISQLKKIKPISCLGFSETFNPMTVLAARVARVPVFISDRSNPLLSVSNAKFIIKKVTYPKAKGMIAQTSFAKDVFSEKGYNKNILTVPNPLRQIQNPYHDLQYLRRNKVIISVGRLVESKNFIALIRIFSRMSKSDWQLWIVGEGPQRQVLQDTIIDFGLSDRVHLKGQTDNVDAYLQEASIFAFTSLSEGYPNALCEAMGFPLACISYNCPAGPEDIIKDGVNGFLVECNNETQYQEKLEELMSNNDLRVSFSSVAYKIRKNLSHEITSKKYFDFISFFKN